MLLPLVVTLVPAVLQTPDDPVASDVPGDPAAQEQPEDDPTASEEDDEDEDDDDSGGGVVRTGDAADLGTGLDIDVANAPASVPTEKRSDKGLDPYLAPIPFRNPNIGWGLAVTVGALFQLDRHNPKTPASSLSVGGFYTENDSKGGLILARLFFPDDKWRVNALGGTVDINYDFFGIGNELGDLGIAVPLNTEADGGRIEVKRAVGDNWYAGLAVSGFDTTSRIDGDTSGLPFQLPVTELGIKSVGIGVQAEYDTRDNRFYPTDGSLANIEWNSFDEDFGGDRSYGLFRGSWYGFTAFDDGDDGVLGYGGSVMYASDEAPFFVLPSYRVRGYEGGRYRDQLRLALELEYRQRFNDRFGWVVFGGLGQVSEDFGDLEWDNVLPSIGAGLRFKLTKKNPLDYRIDVASGRNDVFFYFSVGQAW